jgi:ElaB/YqjD/DUF883 family membrane-anchored ribosome-binding protein
MSASISQPSHLSTDRPDTPLAAAGSAVREFGRSAAESARELGQTASREAEHVGISTRQWWAQSREDAHHAMQRVREHAAALGEDAQDYMREGPFRALTAAAALGAALAGLAMLVSRRRR